MGMLDVPLPDGRRLEVLTGGDPAGPPLLFHYGTPSAACPFAPLDEAVRRHGLRLIGYSRPGYGGSTPRLSDARDPRLTADVEDVVALLDHVGVDEFATMGWSGGGSRALACAALLGGRCRGAVDLAGLAPYDADGLDWFTGMDADEREEWREARAGDDAFAARLRPEAEAFRDITGEQILTRFGDRGCAADRAALTLEYADWVAATFRGAVRQGVGGYVRDNMTEVRPWGFDPAAVAVPVIVWHGREDRNVPIAHGEWLAATIPTAVAHLGDDDGHFSWLPQLDALLDELVELSGVSPVRYPPDAVAPGSG